MGFKEIEKSNDALLAKQVWRLINNPTSLCYWVFKPRFFFRTALFLKLGNLLWVPMLGKVFLVQGMLFIKG